MGDTTAKKGVLKLVHPGRHVEIHKQPITAAEVIRKNPRHSITRPEVFKFPWLVVRPESILLPGEVFFIVPNTTVYNLMKEYKSRNQPHQHEQSSERRYKHNVTSFKQDALIGGSGTWEELDSESSEREVSTSSSDRLLRKPNSFRKSDNLNEHFDLPNGYKKQMKGVATKDSNYSCQLVEQEIRGSIISVYHIFELMYDGCFRYFSEYGT